MRRDRREEPRAETCEPQFLIRRSDVPCFLMALLAVGTANLLLHAVPIYAMPGDPDSAPALQLTGCYCCQCCHPLAKSKAYQYGRFALNLVLS